MFHYILTHGMPATTKPSSATGLGDLNDDVLLHIFGFASVRELRRLSCVCRRFAMLIEQSVIPRRCTKLLMTSYPPAANSIRTRHQQRTLRTFTLLERLRVQAAWQTGRYKECTLFQHRLMYQSFVHLERRAIYMSHGGEIRRHRRHMKDNFAQIDETPEQTIGSERLADVTCFRRRDRVLFGGRLNGDYFVLDERQATGDGDGAVDGYCVDVQLCEARTLGADGDRATVPITAVDMRGECFVTANEERLTVWRRDWELGDVVLQPMADVNEFFKAVAIQPGSRGGDGDEGPTCGEWLACGKYRDRNRTALELIHLER